MPNLSLMFTAPNVSNTPYVNDQCASDLSSGGGRSMVTGDPSGPIAPPASRKFDLRACFFQEKQESAGNGKIQPVERLSLAYCCGKKFNARRLFRPRLVSDQSRP
jgi:hypothetical protein